MYRYQFAWLSERGGNFLNLLQKEGLPRKGGGVPSEKGTGVLTLEETMDKSNALTVRFVCRVLWP